VGLGAGTSICSLNNGNYATIVNMSFCIFDYNDRLISQVALDIYAAEYSVVKQLSDGNILAA